MKSTKQLGIWIDHSIAHLMELRDGEVVTNNVESSPELQQDQKMVNKDESIILNKEEGQLSAYYKKLSDLILDYEEVLLFGPTDAKNELSNLLKEDHHFDKIRVEVKSSDNMTENQRIAFVKEYFV